MEASQVTLVRIDGDSGDSREGAVNGSLVKSLKSLSYGQVWLTSAFSSSFSPI